MGVIISSKTDIDNYFESDRLSQSSLKKLKDGLSFFLAEQNNKLYYEEKSHFINGSAIDCILTGEEGQFEKDYYISKIDKKPSDAIVSIINRVFDLILDWVNNEDQELDAFIGDNGDSISNYKEYIVAACNEAGYGSNWKEETKIGKIVDQDEYFKDLCKSYGKQVLSVAENQLIQEIVSSLRSNPRTCRYFDRKGQSILTNTDFYYQLPIYFIYEGIECKALLDLVIVFKDSNGKITHIEPYDLKTMSGSTLQFLNSVKSFRYDIQAAWYTNAIKAKFGDVDVKNYRFIVESTTFVGIPLIYELSDSLMQIGYNGRSQLKLVDTDFFKNNQEEIPDIIISREIKGVKQLVELYKWYEKNGWDEEKVIVENPSVLNIDWNNVI